MVLNFKLKKNVAMNKLLICFFSIVYILFLLNCQKTLKSEIELSKLIKNKEINFDTSTCISRDSLIHLFDTISIEYGYLFFDKMINSKSLFGSKFKRRWDYEIDSIESVLVCKKNPKLDPFNELTNESYFMLINFKDRISKDWYRATIYFDFEDEIVGDFYLGMADCLKYVRLSEFKCKQKNLAELIRLE
jgi:hypothetical protein